MNTCGPDTMNILHILSLGVLFAMPSGAVEPKASEPVAIVYSLTGKAALAASKLPLRLFDRLPAGTTVEVGPSSHVALAFVNGLRYELGGGSRVTLGARDLASRTGPVQALPRVAPLPRLLPIMAEDRPGPRAGAVRIRREEIDCLSPRDGAVALAGATVLRFQPASGAAHYEVEIEDAQGKVVFHTTTEAPAVSVPTAILAPGASYHWTVKALDRPGPMVWGGAGFVTLSRAAAESRERFRKAIETLADGSSQALLEAVDHGLGITDETCPAGAVGRLLSAPSGGARESAAS